MLKLSDLICVVSPIPLQLEGEYRDKIYGVALVGEYLCDRANRFNSY